PSIGFRRFRIIIEEAGTKNKLGFISRDTTDGQSGENATVALRTDVQQFDRASLAAPRQILVRQHTRGKDRVIAIARNAKLHKLSLDVTHRPCRVRQPDHRSALLADIPQSLDS